MKRFWRLFIVAVVIVLASVGMAQEIDPEAADAFVEALGKMAASASALAGVIAVVTSFFKNNVFKTDGPATLIVSVILGQVGAFTLSFGNYLTGSTFEVITFGATASLIASGGWDLLKGLFSGGKSQSQESGK